MRNAGEFEWHIILVIAVCGGGSGGAWLDIY